MLLACIYLSNLIKSCKQWFKQEKFIFYCSHLFWTFKWEHRKQYFLNWEFLLLMMFQTLIYELCKQIWYRYIYLCYLQLFVCFQVSYILPDTFAEKILRIYVRNIQYDIKDALFPRLQGKFMDWCCKNNLPLPKV